MLLSLNLLFRSRAPFRRLVLHVITKKNTGRFNPMDPKKEFDYADEIPDDEDDSAANTEPVYRDGSAQNECWAVDDR